MPDIHEIQYRRKVVYEAHFDAAFVDPDGGLTPDALADGEYTDAKSEVFECTCGRRFYKEETAAEHLRDVME